MPSRWLVHAWICAPDSNGTVVNARTTSLNGQLVIRRYLPTFDLQKFFEYVSPTHAILCILIEFNLWQRTLDYLFHDLLPRGGFSATFNFIRDRSRAVRSDFT